jgi:hypothetical protein
MPKPLSGPPIGYPHRYPDRGWRATRPPLLGLCALPSWPCSTRGRRPITPSRSNSPAGPSSAHFSEQPIALVVAEEWEIARYAASLVRVDYDEQAFVTDISGSAARPRSSKSRTRRAATRPGRSQRQNIIFALALLYPATALAQGTIPPRARPGRAAAWRRGVMIPA